MAQHAARHLYRVRTCRRLPLAAMVLWPLAAADAQHAVTMA
jgi:hypothetical protein